jgi:uncharacterized membrane protein YgdD (TMEM256/DUF423 family)
MRPNWILVGCLSAALAVMLGAYGAHGIQAKVSQADYEVWKTAVLYQAIHALALVLFGIFAELRAREGRTASAVPGWTFLLGTLCFSGPLYGHPLDAPAWTLHLAPVGGLALMLGWVLFGLAAIRARSTTPSDGR